MYACLTLREPHVSYKVHGPDYGIMMLTFGDGASASIK